MVRPSIVDTDVHRLPTRATATADLYPWRPPQIGNAFQVRPLPQLQESYIQLRRSPLPLSGEHPHRTVAEIEAGKPTNVRDGDAVPTSDEEKQHVRMGYGTTRGGELVHRAVDDTAWFAAFVSSFNPTNKSTSLWEWSLELRQWETYHRDAHRRSRGTKKRKHVSLPISMTAAQPKRLHTSESESEQAWNYLWKNHGGNVAQASLACLVNFGDGAAHASLLRGEGYSWREFVQRRVCVIAGNFSDNDRSVETSMETDWDAESLRDTWDAVLHCAKMVCQDQPIALSALARFLAMAARLPEAMDMTSSREVNMTMAALVKKFLAARQERAKLFDLLSQKQGVDVDTLRKIIEKASASPIVIDEMDELKRQVRQVSAWQQRLENIFSQCTTDDNQDERDDMASLQDLQREGRRHGFRSKSFVGLEQKLEKANALRDRIVAFQGSTEVASLKTVSAIVREIHRLKIRFPAVNEMLLFHQEIETWVDRANIATRSRLSLNEVTLLIEQGRSLSVDVSDLVAKLALRVESANEWINRLNDMIGYRGDDRWTMIDKIRAYMEYDCVQLQELANEGNRMPVDVDQIQLLQIELDANMWTSKTQKWLGNSGRLAEMRDHLEHASSLRDRLTVVEKSRWTLHGEDQLTAIVNGADRWLAVAEPILAKSSSISIQHLHKLHKEGNELDVALGQPMAKLAKSVLLADKWFDQYEAVVTKCSLKQVISNDEIVDALRASVEIGVNLDEVMRLREVQNEIKIWLTAFAVAVGDRVGDPVTLDQVDDLMEEAMTLPIDTQSHVERLQQEKTRVCKWQEETKELIAPLLSSLNTMEEVVRGKYGDPANLTWEVLDTNARSSDESPRAEIDSIADGSSCAAELCPTLGAKEIQDQLDSLCFQSSSFTIKTPESLAFRDCSKVLRWVFQSIQHMHSRRYVFDKRFFGAFDRFVKESKTFQFAKFDIEPLCRIVMACENLVNDQCTRLRCLVALRQRYVKTCKQVEQVLSSPNPTIEKLIELSESSYLYPALDDPIKVLNSRLEEAKAWVKEVSRTLEASGKVTLGEANAFLSQADSIGFVCKEASSLRTGVTSARNWARRVRKQCKDNNLGLAKVKSLSKEYDALIIEMPDDYQKLGVACMKYCVCRKGYSGFMICCDECEDWFHGECVGISETSVKKKYLCIRCNIQKTYNASASTIANIVRKFSSSKELERVRAHEEKRLTNREAKHTEAYNELQQKRAELDKQFLVAQERALASARLDPPCSSFSGLSDTNTSAQVMDGSVDTIRQGKDSTSLDGVIPEESPASGSVELSRKLQAIADDIKKSFSRIQRITTHREDLRKIWDEEDIRLEDLKEWSLKIRSLILAPPSEDVARASRPNPDGSLSSVMLALEKEARVMRLDQFNDIRAVINHIKCLAWCMRAAKVFARQPSGLELRGLVDSGNLVFAASQLATTMKTLKMFLSRLKAWEARVFAELRPNPSSTENFNEAALTSLVREGERIPFRTSVSDRIKTVLEDSAQRHCLCGGPSDGRFMIGCDGCNRWFHGHCVSISKNTPEDELNNWSCPECSKQPIHLDLANFHSNYDVSDDESDGEDSFAPKITKPDQLWPPLGLLYSDKAIKALGADCCAAPATTTTSAFVRPILPLKKEPNVNEKSLSGGVVTPVAIKSSDTSMKVQSAPTDF